MGAPDSLLEGLDGFEDRGTADLLGADQHAHVVELAECRAEVPRVGAGEPQLVKPRVLEVVDAHEQSVPLWRLDP